MFFHFDNQELQMLLKRPPPPGRHRRRNHRRSPWRMSSWCGAGPPGQGGGGHFYLRSFHQSLLQIGGRRQTSSLESGLHSCFILIASWSRRWPEKTLRCYGVSLGPDISFKLNTVDEDDLWPQYYGLLFLEVHTHISIIHTTYLWFTSLKVWSGS